MRLAAVLLVGLLAPASAQSPLTLVVDGIALGPITEHVYDTSSGEVRVETEGLVVGCEQDRIFRDRFDG